MGRWDEGLEKARGGMSVRVRQGKVALGPAGL